MNKPTTPTISHFVEKTNKTQAIYPGTRLRNLLILMCFLISYTGLYGQQAVKVEYNYHFYTVRGYEVNRPMILTSSNERSKFYNPVTNRIDSICDTPEGKAEWDAFKKRLK